MTGHQRAPKWSPGLNILYQSTKLPAAVAPVISISPTHSVAVAMYTIAISTDTVAVPIDGSGTDTTVRAANYGGVLNV
jgi:hypothetical protein